MADRVVLVEINYDTAQAVSNLEKLTNAVEAEKAAQKKLKDDLKAGLITQAEYSLEVEKSKAAMNKANAERKSTIQLLGAEKGSVNEIKAAIKQMTLERDKLNGKTAEGRAAIRAYNQQLDALNESLNEARGKSKGFLGTLESMPGPLGGIISGIKGMTMASLSFIATPLGAILAAIALVVGGLVSVFKSFDPLLDKIAQGAAAVSAAFTWLKEAVIGLVTGQKAHNESMRDAIDAAIKLKKAEQDLEEQTVALRVAEAKSKRQIDELLLQSKDRTKSEKERIALIDEALKVEEDAYKRRKDIADKELMIAQGKIINGRNLSKEEIANLKSGGVEYAFQLQQRKGITDDEINVLADALTKQEEILNESVNIREKAINRQNALEDKAKEEAEKRAEELAKIREKKAEEERKRQEERMKLEQKFLDVHKAAAESVKKVNQDISDFDKALMADFASDIEKNNAEIQKLEDENIKVRTESILELAKLKEQDLIKDASNEEEKKKAQIAAADAEMQRKIDASKGTAEELELIEYEHQLAIEQIKLDFENREKERRGEELEERLADMQMIIDASRGMADERVLISADAFAKISTINWEELEDNKAKFVAIAGAAKGLTNFITAGYDRQLSALEKEKAYELSLVGDNADAKAIIEEEYNKKANKLKKEQAQKEKQKAIVDSLIATAIAVVKSIAASPLTGGLPFSAIVGALGAAQTAYIASQPAVFAKGGMIGGNPHSQGGTKFWGEDGSMFEAEKGEAMFVLKKDATAEIAALSALNESFGGRSWTSGKESGYMEDGGAVNAPDMSRAVAEVLQNTPIIVRVEDITTGMSNVENVKMAGVI